jgi:tripartite-type tricarboxylate transporter receptor subunit TctC
MTGHLRSGTLRGIVISSRYPDFPDIPTLSELGYSEQLFGVWVGFFAPAGVPAEVTRTLVPALERAIKSPAIGAKLKPLGMLMDYSPPEKLLAEVLEEHARVQGLARKAGLPANRSRQLDLAAAAQRTLRNDDRELPGGAAS